MCRYKKWLPKSPGLAALSEQQLFIGRLLDDIHSGDVFPAVRGQKVDFYHYGQKLFSFDGSKFRTNIAYAVVLHAALQGEIGEADLAAIPIFQNFYDAYDGIKKQVRGHQKAEASGVFELCKKHSFIKWSEENRIVVLDIELSLAALERPGQDRIDLVLFNTSSKTLQFVEAKAFSNDELRPAEFAKPPVIDQIDRYNKQLDERKAQLLADYQQYVSILNHCFGRELPIPNDIAPSVDLLVFGFSGHDKERVKKLLREIRQHMPNLRCHPIGSTSRVTQATLQEKWRI